MDELAMAAAEAMAALGSCDEGSWQDRKAALLAAGRMCNYGFDEVLGWFDIETEE